MNNPRLERVLETLGYAIGLRFDLPSVQATQFGEWLSETVMGWSDEQTAEHDLSHLGRVARRATFRPASTAVLNVLQLQRNEAHCPAAD